LAPPEQKKDDEATPPAEKAGKGVGYMDMSSEVLLPTYEKRKKQLHLVWLEGFLTGTIVGSFLMVIIAYLLIA